MASKTLTRTSPADLDSFLVEARRIQSDGTKTEVEYMRFLFISEKNKHLWEGYRSFQQLVENMNLCPVRRYVDFKTAHTKLTLRQVEQFGVDGSIEVAKIDSPDDLRTAVRAVQAWTTDNKVTPTRQRVVSILKKNLPHLRGSSYIRRHSWAAVNDQGNPTGTQWCSHCGTLHEKASLGVSLYTKPGHEPSNDLPPCARVHNKTPKQLVE